MILPPPACFITGCAACEHRNALVRLVLITLSHSSGSSVCGGLRILMPALLTRMSIRPSSRLTRSTILATAALSVTSAMTDIALTPRLRRSATAAFDFASLRPTTAMPAPASARPRAMPSPMPPLPPGTMATLPLRSNIDVVMVSVPVMLSGRWCYETWTAGTSPAITSQPCVGFALTLALPDQDQAERGQRCSISGPLHLADHEARLRPVDHAQALADPEQADGEREQPNDQQQSAHGISSHRPMLCPRHRPQSGFGNLLGRRR